MIQGKVFTIKDGKHERWNSWINHLQTNLADTLPDQLEENQLLWETWSSFEIDGTQYLVEEVATTESFDPQRKGEPVDQLHQQIKQECLKPVDTLTFLSDINKAD